MNRKIILCMLCVLVVATAHAVVFCPTAEEIKNQHIVEWIPLYVENSEEALPHDLQKFKENIISFSVARFDLSYLEYAHCFYNGTDPIMQKIIFAHDAYRPIGTKWQWTVQGRSAECFSTNPKECGFVL